MTNDPNEPRVDEEQVGQPGHEEIGVDTPNGETVGDTGTFSPFREVGEDPDTPEGD